jgi:hypothetical protein
LLSCSQLACADSLLPFGSFPAQASLPTTLSAQLHTPHLVSTSSPNGLTSSADVSSHGKSPAWIQRRSPEEVASVSGRNAQFTGDLHSSSRLNSARSELQSSTEPPGKASWLAYLFGGSTGRQGATHANAVPERGKQQAGEQGASGVTSSLELIKPRVRTLAAMYMMPASSMTSAASTLHCDVGAANLVAILLSLRWRVQAVRAPRDADRAFAGPHSAAAAMQARAIIAEYAWRWLAEGRLLPLADLQRALALVPCSLPSLMQARPAYSCCRLMDHLAACVACRCRLLVRSTGHACVCAVLASVAYI